VGQPYEVRLVSFRAMKEPAHLALHPFGQIPTYQEGDLALFETGSIVFHIAERHAGLLPDDPNARGARDHLDVRRAQHGGAADRRLSTAMLLERDKPWSRERLPSVESRVRDRLAAALHPSRRRRLARWCVQRGRPADGVVLLRSRSSGILDEFGNLAAYLARGEARPAYQRAFAAQRAINSAD
jgi:glutathione S-transferase